MSFLDEATAPDFASRGGRLYAHADFLGTIVPACLFLLVVFLTEHVCFQEQSILGMLKAHYSLADSRLNSLTDATSLLAVLVGVVFLFCLLFIVGEMLNAVSALTLDHFVTRKLLGYPFSLFVKRLAGVSGQDRAGVVASEDPHLFSREMSTRPYRRLCINVVPLLIFEIIITIHWALDNDALLRHFTTEPKFSVAVAVLLCFFHLGLPIKGPGGERNSRLNLGLAVHILAVLLLGILVGAALVAGYAVALLLFPGINLFLIGWERSKPDSRIIGYMKTSFVNVFYWLAHLAGWAYIPPRSIVELAARRYRHSELDSSDSFYWMCLFEVEQRGGTISAYVYHTRSLYTMMRNLCSAVNMSIAIGLLLPVSPAITCRQGPTVVWFGFLIVVSAVFFVRYLHYQGPMYSRYLLRTAAYFSVERAEEQAKRTA